MSDLKQDQLLTQLKWRYAVKKFDSQKKLSSQQIDQVLEALRLSPSSFGLQPWKFLVITNPEIKSKLKAFSWNQSQVVDASHLIVFCGIKQVDNQFVDQFVDDMVRVRGGQKADLQGYSDVMKSFLSRLDDKAKKEWVKNQIYIALGNLMTFCAFQKIDTCPMEGFVPVDYDKVLNLDKLGLYSVVVCPVGFRASDDKYAQAKKVRYSLDKLVIKLD
jgi:nitroreductase